MFLQKKKTPKAKKPASSVSRGKRKDDETQIVRSRVESTRALVAVMAHLNYKPRVFVSASAVGYYGHRGEEELTEASRAGGGTAPEISSRVWGGGRAAEDCTAGHDNSWTAGGKP